MSIFILRQITFVGGLLCQLFNVILFSCGNLTISVKVLDKHSAAVLLLIIMNTQMSLKHFKIVIVFTSQ